MYPLISGGTPVTRAAQFGTEMVGMEAESCQVLESLAKSERVMSARSLGFFHKSISTKVRRVDKQLRTKSKAYSRNEDRLS